MPTDAGAYGERLVARQAERFNVVGYNLRFHNGIHTKESHKRLPKKEKERLKVGSQNSAEIDVVTYLKRWYWTDKLQYIQVKNWGKPIGLEDVKHDHAKYALVSDATTKPIIVLPDALYDARSTLGGLEILTEANFKKHFDCGRIYGSVSASYHKARKNKRAKRPTKFEFGKLIHRDGFFGGKPLLVKRFTRKATPKQLEDYAQGFADTMKLLIPKGFIYVAKSGFTKTAEAYLKDNDVKAFDFDTWEQYNR